MKYGIDNIKAVMVDIEELVKAGIKIGRSGFSFSTLFAVSGMVDDVRKLIADIPGALPEMTDIDSKESSELGALSYNMIKNIVESLKG